MPTIEVLDLEFQGKPQVIASFLIRGPEGPVLVETGPGSTLPKLQAELSRHGVTPSDIRDVLVTHIHLDHAGAAGWWARQGAKVYVHHLGAPHLIDPGKLIASATRIYGERMGPLWGDILTAPEDRVVAVHDGDVLQVGGLEITALETPGHAWHHHAFRLGDVAFTGDAAGILLPEKNWLDLPAPPPEFDLESWKRTMERLHTARLGTLYRTHFGASASVERELDDFDEVLEQAAELVREMVVQGIERDPMIQAFTRWIRERGAARGVDSVTALAYELANPREMSVDGIARYWRKRLGA